MDGKRIVTIAEKIEGLSALHARTHGSPQVRIAILDGPTDLSHPVFRSSRIKDFRGAISPRLGSSSAAAHGTAVASLIFGQPGTELQGIAPGCEGLLIPIFSYGENGRVIPCSQLELARAILLAVTAGAHLINISGGQLFVADAVDPLLEHAVDECRRLGVLIVAAAGNDGCNCSHLPSAFPWVLAVGATDARGIPIPESNWGEDYKNHGIVAPGKDLPAALPGGAIGSLTGTSAATPLVTGVAALLLSLQYAQSRFIDATIVRQALLDTARPCPEDGPNDCRQYLAGTLDAAAAWRYVKRHLEDTETKSLTSILSLEGSTMSTAAPLTAHQLSQPAPAGNGLQMADEITPSHAAITPSLCEACEHEAATKGDAKSPPSSQPVLPAKIYMLGTIGYDFASESRYYSLAQSSGIQDPARAAEFARYLKQNPHLAESVVWTVKLDDAPIYALRPTGAYAGSAYERLVEFLQAQEAGTIERVSISGLVPGALAHVRSGLALPILIPDVRGMYAWSTDALVSSVCGERPTDEAGQAKHDAKSRRVHQFLDRVYHELRGLGVTAQQRALNFAVTNAYQVEKVFERALADSMELYKIDVERSPVQRPGADCWDVKLIFFSPEKRLERANVEYRITVDVEDVVPATIGQIRTWSTY